MRSPSPPAPLQGNRKSEWLVARVGFTPTRHHDDRPLLPVETALTRPLRRHASQCSEATPPAAGSGEQPGARVERSSETLETVTAAVYQLAGGRRIFTQSAYFAAPCLSFRNATGSARNLRIIREFRLGHSRARHSP